MSTTFYTKQEIALILTNSMPDLTTDQRQRFAIRLARLAEPFFQQTALKAGIHYNFFGYNRYQIL